MSTTYNVTLSGVEYTCEVFTPADGAFSWTPPTAVVFYDAIIVAGGGGGAEQGNGGGAGGAGGVKVRTGVGCLPGVPIAGGVVGSGGIGGTAGSPSPGTNGGNSTFDGVTSTGGGKGGAGSSGSAANNGGAGGSGGGGSGAIASGAAASTGGAGSAGEGNNGAGGAGTGTAGLRNGGGGGGKGSAGIAGVTAGPKAGDGGTGYDASGMFGTGVGDNGWFGSGGGGGSNSTTPGTNGLASAGGGGAGGLGNGNGTNALPGTGGGGGGGGGSTPGASGNGGNGGDGVVIVRYVLSPPDAPTAVSASSTGTTSAELTWSAPVSVGSGLDHYEVRRDGGAEVTATSPHSFTGLSPSTLYDLEVRSVGPGGESAWVSALVTTDAPAPFVVGYYRVELSLGSHSWSFEYGTELDLVADYPHVVLPLTCGWDMPENVEFFPVAPNMTTLGFRVQCNDAADLVDVDKGTPVSFRMFVDNDPEADVWQFFDGVVTQLDGVTVASPADPTKRDLVVTVYAADNNARLADKYVGWSADWPIEHIIERVERIAAEAGIPDVSTISYDGGVGWLPARAQGAAITALSAITAALKDSAESYESEFPDVYYGRPVFQYEPGGLLDLDGFPVDEAIYIRSIRRRVFPSGFGGTVNLDGGLVRAAGSWSKQSGPRAATWGIVDGVTFGTPDGSVPFVRNTSLLDYFGPDGLDQNYSAAERDALGSSLLADNSTALDGWSTRSLVYEASLDPNPVAFWANLYRYGIAVHPVVVAPIGPELELNGVDYVAGTLVGARLVIPAGGRFTVEFRLRSELLDGTDLP